MKVKDSNALKMKISSGFVLILGLMFFIIPIVEIHHGIIKVTEKYGGGEILAANQPFQFWARVVFELLVGAIIIGGGIYMLLVKSSDEEKDLPKKNKIVVDLS